MARLRAVSLWKVSISPATVHTTALPSACRRDGGFGIVGRVSSYTGETVTNTRSYIGLRRPSVLGVYLNPPFTGAPSSLTCGSLAAYGADALVRYQSHHTDVNSGFAAGPDIRTRRSEEHTSELQ